MVKNMYAVVSALYWGPEVESTAYIIYIVPRAQSGRADR